MSDPNFGSYPGLSQSFANVRSMYPHMGGRVSPQIQTNSDFTEYMRYTHLANMQGGYAPYGASRIGVHQESIRNQYAHMPIEPLRSGINSAFGAVQTLAMANRGISMTGTGLNYMSNLVGTGNAFGAKLAQAGGLLSTNSAGVTALTRGLTTASKYAADLSIPVLSKVGAFGLGTAAKIAGGALGGGLPGIIAMEILQRSIGAGINRIQSKRREVVDMQDALSGANFYGTDMAYAGSPNLSSRSARDIARAFKLETKTNKRFHEGELDSVMRYSMENGLMEGHTGNSGQFASRVMSLAKVAKNLMELGAGISAKDAMDLQGMASKLGITGNQLVKGGLVKNIVNAAKISGVTLNEAMARSTEAGAQYLTMGFSANQGASLSAYSTRAAATMVNNGMLTDEQLFRLGGKGGIENAVFRAGTIGMQNNSQLLAMSSLKFSGGNIISDSRIIDEFKAGRLSFDDLTRMAKRNMSALQDASIDKKDQKKLLGAIEAAMPDLIRDISSKMSSEQQMAMAGDAILQRAKGAGGIDAAINEYFGEDTQARDAFKQYAKNFRATSHSLAKQDALAETEKLKNALLAKSDRGVFARAATATEKAFDNIGDAISYGIGLDYLSDKIVNTEQVQMEGAAGYYGGIDENSLLSRYQSSVTGSSRYINTSNLEKFLNGTNLDVFKSLGGGAGGYSGFSGIDELQTKIKNLKITKKLDEHGILTSTDIRDADKFDELGFRLEHNQDEGLFFGDLDQDLLDRLTGQYYSDSTTNEILNIGNTRYQLEDTRGLVAGLEMGKVYMAMDNKSALEDFNSRRLGLFGSKKEEDITKRDNIAKMEKYIDQELEAYTSTGLTKNMGTSYFIGQINKLKNNYGLNDSEAREILANRFNMYINSQDPKDQSKKKAAAQLIEEGKDTLNSFTIKPPPGLYDYTGDASSLNIFLQDIAQEQKSTLAAHETNFGPSGTKDLLIALGGGDSDKFADMTDAEFIQHIGGKVLPNGRKFSSTTTDQLLAIKNKLKNSSPDERKKILAGLKNTALVAASDKDSKMSMEDILNTTDAIAARKAALENLIGPGSSQQMKEMSAMLGDDTKARDNYIKTIKGKADADGFTLGDILSRKDQDSLSSGSREAIRKALGEYNALSNNADKDTKLKEILNKVAIEMGQSKKGKDKDAQNLPNIMDRIATGLTDFNTHVKQIAVGVGSDKPVTIKLVGGTQ